MRSTPLLFAMLVLSTPALALAQPAAPTPAPTPTPTPAPEPAPAESMPAPEAPAPEPAPTPTPEAAPEAVPEEAPAEEPAASGPTVSGFVDATYNYNINNPAGGLSPLHSYTAKTNSFALNAAHLAVAGAIGEVSYDLELDFGSDAAINSGGNRADVQEAYAAYTSSSGLGFKAGKFVTPNGIEVIESGGNPTISRGFLFGLAEPATHVGALATYKVNDTIDVALGLVNGWDLVVDNNFRKTVLAKVGYTTEKLLLTASAYAGPEQPANNKDFRTTFDLTGMAKAGKIDLWFQGNVGAESAGDTTAVWFGAAVEPLIHVDDKLAFGVRAELFADSDGARTGTKQTVFNVSVAPTYTVAKGLVARAEARVDVSSEKVFPKQDATTTGTQVIALTEMIFSF